MEERPYGQDEWIAEQDVPAKDNVGRHPSLSPASRKPPLLNRR